MNNTKRKTRKIIFCFHSVCYKTHPISKKNIKKEKKNTVKSNNKRQDLQLVLRHNFLLSFFLVLLYCFCIRHTTSTTIKSNFLSCNNYSVSFFGFFLIRFIIMEVYIQSNLQFQCLGYKSHGDKMNEFRLEKLCAYVCVCLKSNNKS